MQEKAGCRSWEACQCLTLVLTGNLASIPFKGSLIIPEKNPEAAKFGFPGLTQIVGNRIEYRQPYLF